MFFSKTKGCLDLGAFMVRLCHELRVPFAFYTPSWPCCSFLVLFSLHEFCCKTIKTLPQCTRAVDGLKPSSLAVALPRTLFFDLTPRHHTAYRVYNSRNQKHYNIPTHNMRTPKLSDAYSDTSRKCVGNDTIRQLPPSPITMTAVYG